MAQSYGRIFVHTIFSTKYRQWTITEDIEAELHQFMRNLLKSFGCRVEEIGGVEDHVHLLHTLPRTMTIAKLIEAVKSLSTKYLRGEFGHTCAEFQWQRGYSCFSVDYRNLEKVKSYVRNQRAHHGRTPHTSGIGLDYEIAYLTELAKILDVYECDYKVEFLSQT